MSWKERLKNSQGGGTKYPKLDIVQSFDLKEDEKTGKPMFSWWDSVKEERVFSAKAITGIYIGRAFRASCFDDKFGTNGASYTSAMYMNKSNVTMFSPTGSNKMTGHLDEIEIWLRGNGVGDKISKKMCLLILTTGGLMEIRTNVSIGIDELNRFDDKLGSHFVSLTPTLYSVDDEDISKKAHKFLGKFAKKNPPKYAAISIGKQITDEDAEKIGLIKNIDMFEEWSNFVSTGGVEEEEAVAENTKTEASYEDMMASFEKNSDEPQPPPLTTKDAPEEKEEEEDTGLPF